MNKRQRRKRDGWARYCLALLNIGAATAECTESMRQLAHAMQEAHRVGSRMRWYDPTRYRRVQRLANAVAPTCPHSAYSLTQAGRVFKRPTRDDIRLSAELSCASNRDVVEIARLIARGKGQAVP